MSNVTYNVIRDTGHPWSGEPGWDILMIQSVGDAGKLIAECERRGWQCWSTGESLRGTWRGIFFKPSRLAVGMQACHWFDPAPWPELEG